MPSAVEILPCEGTYVKIALTAKGHLYFVLPLGNEGGKPDAGYAERVIDQPFGITVL